MNSYLIYFFIGLSLSMDAFSVALSLGNISIDKKIIKTLSITIGLFHFIMPNLGYLLTNLIKKNIFINTNIISASIFFFLAIIMFKNIKENIKISSLSIITIFLISLSVSLDSFSVGIALSLQNENIIIASSIFSIVSATITQLGGNLGETISASSNNKVQLISPIILILIAIKYLISA